MHRAMMLLRLPGALREVLLGAQLPSRCRAFSSSSSTITTAATTSRTTTTTTTTTTATTAPQDPGPLRILFCGSDAFSIESLRALHAAQQQDPAFIEAIHVVHRPAKPTGRGLKTLREVPISPLATSLSLPTHPLNTFTHWTPPFSYNLVIAVSFGLLIPPRILALAPHGGLNVHPSLLPDLRGSAPIQHAILQQRPFTGVTVQTLHPTRFDAGVVLRQTGSPGLPIGKEETRAELEARLAAEGAAMLVDVLRQGLYRSPVQEGGWWQGKGEGVDAPKLTKRHHEVDFATMTLDRVRAGIRALGHVWCALPNGERLIVHEVVAADANANAEQEQEQEQEQLARVERKASMRLWYDEARDELLFRAACGSLGVITSSTYPGGKARRGNGKVASMLMKERAGL